MIERFSDILIHIGQYLDSSSLLALYRTCQSIKNMLDESEQVGSSYKIAI
jgi:hypothetical protein